MNKSNHLNGLKIVAVTVLLTSIILIGLSYSLGWLSFGNSREQPLSSLDQVNGSALNHAEGMVHTEGMVHSDELHSSLMESSQRQEEVAERGHMVMPFDLERTTHVFEKASFGGVQQVLSDDGDQAQIDLIQAHLLEEYGRFQTGDFSDPAFIHGDEMPGLSTLAEQFAEIEITYEPLSNGGKIVYSATDAAVIDAIHIWFDAQLMDHGSHATDGG